MRVTVPNLKTLLLTMTMLSGLAMPTLASAAPQNTTVVLVHGAFVDGSEWNKVVPLLQAKGLKVVSVQNPLTSLAEDVAATQRAIAQQAGKVVLVGHSWGGMVITEAGASDKVRVRLFIFRPLHLPKVRQLATWAKNMNLRPV